MLEVRIKGQAQLSLFTPSANVPFAHFARLQCFAAKKNREEGKFAEGETQTSIITKATF
jgi:hypothetical protein